MIAVHVTVTTSPDYLTRREACRRAHIERLAGLRARGILVAGGPTPDGRTAEMFYRLEDAGQLPALVEQDPYYAGGAWTGYTTRSFAQFVEPWEQPPIVLDGTRRATLVEGPATDPEMAQLALIELRGAGRLVFGGTFDGRETLAVLRAADPVEATGWLADAGFWAPEELTARAWLYVL